jgi:2-oxoglutarate ferredoxin oxidoreductase subunit alpha
MHLIVLAPASVQEMAALTSTAFDLADIYRTPVMILADGALGQMMEPVEFTAGSERELPEKNWTACGHDGKRKKNIINSLYMEPADLEASIRDRFDRYQIIKDKETMYQEVETDDADIILVAYGITSRICKTALSMARAKGIKAGLIRPITLWPFPDKPLAKAAKTASDFLVVELNMGQMVDDVKVAIDCKKPVSFFGRTGGVMPSPEDVLAEIEKIAGGKK